MERLITLALVIVLGCATPSEVQYEVAYRGIPPSMVVSLALEATALRG